MGIPNLDCEVCLAKQFCKVYSKEIVVGEQECSGIVLLHHHLKMSRIPAIYYDANLYSYNVTNNNNFVYGYMKSIVDNINSFVASGYNISFYSETPGTGKTYHGCVILNHFLYKMCQFYDFEHPYSLFISYPDLVNRLRVNWGEMEEELDLIKNVPLLMLDDVGAGTMSDYAREQTFIIIDYRVMKGLSTIYTSNLSLAEMQSNNLLGKRIVSRIKNKCRGFLLVGDDLREVGWEF